MVISFVLLHEDKATAGADSSHGGRAGTAESVENHRARLGRVLDKLLNQGYRLLRGVNLRAVGTLCPGGETLYVGNYVCSADIRALSGMEQHKFVYKCVMIARTAQFIPNEHIMGLQDFIEQRVIKSISAPVTEKVNTGFRLGNSAVLVE